MDWSFVYASEQELDDQRIAICQHLQTIDPDNANIYSEEISLRTRASKVRQAMHHVDNNKVYVDTSGIKRSLGRIFDDLFERYKDFRSLEPTIRTHVISFDQGGEPTTKTFTVIYADLAMKLFNSLFDEVRDRYISSNEYGLDSYLSLRIRHGTLAGQIRSLFEEQHLITRASAEGSEYEPNLYWREALSEFSPLGWITLNAAFSKMSKEVDQTIEEVKRDWLQIRSDTHEDGMFDFLFTESERESFY
jgi:hypothetical protein